MASILRIIGQRLALGVLTLFVANGVTTMRGMLGRPAHLVLRQQLADGDKFGPRLITSGPSLNGNSVRSPADGEEKVRAQHAAGYDFIKIHPGLTSAEFFAIAEERTRGSTSCGCFDPRGTGGDFDFVWTLTSRFS